MKKKKYDTHTEKTKETLLLSPANIDFENLTADQKKAATDIDNWYYSKKSSKADMVYRLGGVGGSGKSFLIKYLIEKYQFDIEDCYVVAYTGQAVNVLRRSGIMAKTIHSTFMKAKEVPLMEDGKPVYFRGVPVTRTRFTPIKKIPPTVKLIICDEASFVSEDLEKLMLSYNVPLLEVGDPIQLPPVAGKQCFNLDNLNCFMEDIMRQALESEIIRLSMAIRHYEPIDSRDYGREVKFLWAQEDIEKTFFRFKPFIRGADMILTTKNKDRKELIDLYRKHILHAGSPYPIKGEKLICRQNDWNIQLGPYPLTNGTQGIAVHTVTKSEVDSVSKNFFLDFQPTFIDDDYFDGLICDSQFIRRDYGDKDSDKLSKYNPGKKFEYAHAITVHSSQGSSANTVMFLDSFNRDAEYHMRLRYTAVTRAVERLYFVLPYFAKYPGWTDLWRGGFRP